MRTLIKTNIFYVYEHWRPDTDICFYVGKGYGNRAYRLNKRNKRHKAIVTKLSNLGMCVEIRLIESGLSEAIAFTKEISRIKFWRDVGVILANSTEGGEGVAGLKHSDETKEKLRQRSLGNIVIHSEETKKKIGIANSIALKGRKNPEHSARMKGRKCSEETKRKISLSGIGREFSEEVRAKISAGNKGQKRSEEARANMSAAHIGKKHSEETREKMATSQKLRWAKCQQ